MRRVARRVASRMDQEKTAFQLVMVLLIVKRTEESGGEFGGKQDMSKKNLLFNL